MLSVAVDDHDLGINYIIRGDDHLNNTFRQKYIYEFMEWKEPKYSHIPLIHGEDGSKLSKRHGAVNIIDLKKIGYLPAASEDQFNIKPIYKTFPGWKSSTQGIRNIKDLPEKAKNYIYALEDFIGAKVSSISTSPERDDTILIEDPFKV